MYVLYSTFWFSAFYYVGVRFHTEMITLWFLIYATRASLPSCNECVNSIEVETNATTAQGHHGINMVADGPRPSACPYSPSTSSSRQGGTLIAPPTCLWRPNPLWAGAMMPRQMTMEKTLACLVTDTASVYTDYAGSASFSSDAMIGVFCTDGEAISLYVGLDGSLYSTTLLSSGGTAYLKALERALEADGLLEFRKMQQCLESKLGPAAGSTLWGELPGAVVLPHS